MFLSLGNFALVLCQLDEFRLVVGIQFQARSGFGRQGSTVDRPSARIPSGGTGGSKEYDDVGELALVVDVRAKGGGQSDGVTGSQ